MGGGDSSSGPTLQQQQLQTEQALTNANLNLQENQQRKSILNAMMGTRVFRGSALSRALVGNTPGQGGENDAPAPSRSQPASSSAPIISTSGESLLDQALAASSGATPAGGTGASANATALTARAGAYGGSGGARLLGAH